MAPDPPVPLTSAAPNSRSFAASASWPLSWLLFAVGKYLTITSLSSQIVVSFKHWGDFIHVYEASSNIVAIEIFNRYFRLYWLDVGDTHHFVYKSA